MNNSIKDHGKRLDMSNTVDPAEAKAELNRLVKFMATVKNTARIRAKTEVQDAFTSVNFLHTRTGTIFGQLFKAITSRMPEAVRQRQLARDLILRVVNSLELNGDQEANKIYSSIRTVLCDVKNEFNKVVLEKELQNLLSRLQIIDGLQKQPANLIADDYNDNDADNYAPATSKKDDEKVPVQDQQSEENAPLLNTLKNAEKNDIKDLPSIASNFETKESIENSLTRSIESTSKNEEANNFMAEISVSVDADNIPLSTKNNSIETKKNKNEHLELVSLDKNMSRDPNAFHKIEMPFSITSYQTIKSIHADVYLFPKHSPLTFNEEKLINEKNSNEEKYEIDRGEQVLSTGLRNYIKLKLDNSITPGGGPPSALKATATSKYQNDLVALYTASVKAVMSLLREEGKNPIKTIAINPVTFTNNVASNVEIQALAIALREIRDSHPDLFICIVTTGPLKNKIVEAMKQPEQLPI